MDTIKITALISLLDDPNEEIFNEVEKALKDLMLDALPYLEKTQEMPTNELFQGRVERIVHTIQFNHVKTELVKWIETGSEDLLYGSYLVAKYNYPNLEYKWLESQITEIRKDIWFEMNEQLSALEKVKIVNHILFNVYKYSRNNINVMSAENNFISEVLTSKKGNPISLSVIYSVVCQRLGLPIYGVNLPKNFILCYLDCGESNSKLMAQSQVMFYINPINKGAVLGQKEIEFFLKQQKITPQPSYFLPIKSNEEIIKRMFNNILYAYEMVNNQEKANEITELLSLFNPLD